MTLEGKTVVLGVTGGIAAYKAAEVASKLTQLGACVLTIMTEHATRLVTPLTFQSLTGQRAETDLFAAEERFEIGHIALAERADLVLIAPATANILAKVAAGIADDLLTTTVCATKAPVVFAPAMNPNMWENPVTRRNVATLRELGHGFIDPQKGRMACGSEGWGRLASPQRIVEAVVGLLCRRQDLAGVRVLVTAGPTREPLDPVRFLSNRSSGRMGCALGEAAAARGATVTLVAGPLSIPPPPGVETVPVLTTAEMYDAVLRRADEQDILICAAAPCDFRAAQVAEQKLKKGSLGADTISLAPTVDILRELGARKRRQVLVGFAAETENVLDNAATKLREKNLDLNVVNDVSQPDAGFEVETNRVTLLWPDGRTEPVDLMSKRELADVILDQALQIRQSPGQ
jgi:phosphopantothenoylcysteine decarboxylase/phosphopantothenate--cysteine ligase